jgi:hypothetical protein
LRSHRGVLKGFVYVAESNSKDDMESMKFLSVIGGLPVAEQTLYKKSLVLRNGMATETTLI